MYVIIVTVLADLTTACGTLVAIYRQALEATCTLLHSPDVAASTNLFYIVLTYEDGAKAASIGNTTSTEA